jgi:PAS domain S-box-containing protein
MPVETQFEDRKDALEDAVPWHFKALVDSSDDAIISKDLNGIIRTWNKGAEKIFGYTADEVIGKPVTILFAPDNLDEEPSILARIRVGERIDHYETIRRRKNGELIDISLTVSPIKNDAGKIIGASKIARDITAKKRGDAELRRMHKELENANRAKDRFLAMLSHELRTPLNPVLLLASDAATDPSLSPETRFAFESILQNVETEARLIDDLLDLTRITAGKLKLERTKLKVNQALMNSIAMVKSQAQQKEIVVEEKLGNPESVVWGDGVRLQQVYSNILKNAIKFTPPKGRVAVRAGATDGEYVVSVSDTGMGMTMHELAVVFEPFRQGEHSENQHQYGGLGLGLAISKQFIEFHQGTIDATSEGRGRGSTFTIRLPLLNEQESNGKTEFSPAQARAAHCERAGESLCI